MCGHAGIGVWSLVVGWKRAITLILCKMESWQVVLRMGAICLSQIGHTPSEEQVHNLGGGDVSESKVAVSIFWQFGMVCWLQRFVDRDCLVIKTGLLQSEDLLLPHE